MRRRANLLRRGAAGLAALGLAAAALVTAGCSVNPATGQRQLALIGEGQEVAVGRQADQEVRTSIGLYGDEALQSYVAGLGEALASRSERPDLPWQFGVVDDPAVNAFALPGGFVYVTRGILGYLNSEAELASVLGHEIGHVTARHSVEQMSKAQLATLGLGVAMIADEELRQFGGVAEAGLGLLFLKFSRDDERQADDLGLRYLVRAGYEPAEMPKVFATLGRVSAGQPAGRIPSWLATHPDPVDREARISQQVAALFPEERGTAVNRDAYLRRLDGLVFGDDPREGFVEGHVFYHPQLAFQLTLPDGWKTANQKQAVTALSPKQDAAVVLTLAAEATPEAASEAFFGRQGIERGDAWQRGFSRYRSLTEAGAEQTRGIVGFPSLGGRVYQLRGIALPERWADHEAAISASLASFRPLTDRRYLAVQPKRVDLVQLPRAMTFAEFTARYPSTVAADTLAVANGVTAEERLAAGRLVKRVVGGELP
jgi:predicted Zn-dependent protease